MTERMKAATEAAETVAHELGNMRFDKSMTPRAALVVQVAHPIAVALARLLRDAEQPE